MRPATAPGHARASAIGSRHYRADHALEREHDERPAGDGHARHGDDDRLAGRAGETTVVDVRADVTDRERDAQEQARRVGPLQVDPDPHRDERDAIEAATPSRALVNRSST